MIVFAAYATDAKRDDYTPAPLRTECAERDFQECLKSFDTIVEHPSLGFAATEAELNQACRQVVFVRTSRISQGKHAIMRNHRGF